MWHIAAAGQHLPRSQHLLHPQSAPCHVQQFCMYHDRVFSVCSSPMIVARQAVKAPSQHCQHIHGLSGSVCTLSTAVALCQKVFDTVLQSTNEISTTSL